MQCCSVLWAVPTQPCSFAEMGIGSHVRPTRQSRDCLRGRPFRTLPISAILRSALGSVQPTVARGALAALRRIPTPPPPVASVVVLRIQAHMRSHGLGRNTSHKPCASPLRPSSQSRRPRRLWPRGLCTLSARAVSRVSRFIVYGASLEACAYRMEQ